MQVLAGVGGRTLAQPQEPCRGPRMCRCEDGHGLVSKPSDPDVGAEVMGLGGRRSQSGLLWSHSQALLSLRKGREPAPSPAVTSLPSPLQVTSHCSVVNHSCRPFLTNKLKFWPV